MMTTLRGACILSLCMSWRVEEDDEMEWEHVFTHSDNQNGGGNRR